MSEAQQGPETCEVISATRAISYSAFDRSYSGIRISESFVANM